MNARIAASISLIFATVAPFTARHSSAQTVPKLLPFQGRLTDQNGVVISNGAKVVQFKIYSVPTGGSPVWAGEVHRTTVNGGLVNVILGTKTPLDKIDFNQQLYLEVTADVSGPGGVPDNAITSADPPMLPRQLIQPAIFAKESADSRKLAGYDWTPVFGTNSPSGFIPGGKIQPQGITSAQIADQTLTASQIAQQSLTGNVLAPQTITSNQIAQGTIGPAQLAAGSIGAAQLAAQLLVDTIIPPGTIVAFGGQADHVPPGWVLCDGRQLPRSSFSNLFSAIGTAWGFDDPSSFRVPDLRGVFLRGVALGKTSYDPDVTNRTPINAGANVGNNVGSFQPDEFASHRHEMSGQNNADKSGIANVGGVGAGAAPTGFFVASAGGKETRPKNVYVNYIIKY